jgi:hypothetical protein
LKPLGHSLFNIEAAPGWDYSLFFYFFNFFVFFFCKMLMAMIPTVNHSSNR